MSKPRRRFAEAHEILRSKRGVVPICSHMVHSSAGALRFLAAVSVVALAIACSANSPNVAAPGATSPQAASPGSAKAPGKAEAGATADCQPWATVVDGPYRFTNNVWGKDKAKGSSEQCLLSRSVEGRVERGWTWSFPGFDPSVFAGRIPTKVWNEKG